MSIAAPARRAQDAPVMNATGLTLNVTVHSPALSATSSSRPLPRKRSAITVLTALACLSGVSVTPMAAARSVALAPHKATYKLSLDHARLQSGVSDVTGKMSFAWNDACDGWTIDQRFQVKFVYTEGEEMDLVTNYATWEAKDGTSYRFSVRKLVNGNPDEELSGGATLDGNKGGTAYYDKPEARELELKPGTMFPSAHTMRILSQVGSGDNLFSVPLFDGSEAEGPSPVNTVLGKMRTPPALKVKDGDLLKAKAWQVSLAFFPSNPGEALPDYETSMELLENGVVRSMLVDYGDFRVKMELESLEKAPKPPC